MTVYINGIPQNGNGAEGVSQADFDAHTHNYRKITQLGIDTNKNYPAPTKVVIDDDTETFVTDGNDAEAIGVTVATEPTTTPN